MWRSQLLIVGTLVLSACPYEAPLPRSLDVSFEFEADRVLIEAALHDLVFRKDDALSNFVGYAHLADAQSFTRSLHDDAHAMWITQVSSQHVSESEGQLSMRITGTATREMFERCARRPEAGNDTSGADQECSLFPLRLKGQRYVLDVADDYAPAPRAQNSWPTTAKRINVKLSLMEASARHRALSAYRRYVADEKSAQRAVAWIQAYSEAFKQADVKKLAELHQEMESHSPHTKGLLEEHAQRWRVSFLYRVLLHQRSRDLLQLDAASYIEGEQTKDIVPKAGLPQSFVRDLRLLYEVGGRRAETFADWRMYACQQASKAGKDEQYICSMLGHSAGAKKIPLHR